jgi:hypothetical protein
MNISNMISSLIQNPWIIFISLFLAPVGVILAILFYFKSKRKKSIKFCQKNDLLIRDFIQKVDGLNIEYLGNKIKTLSIAKIAIWNDGTETINGYDIPKHDNFFISIDNNHDILDVSIIQTTNKSNDIKVKLSEDKKEINIDFEYLDKKDGFVLQLFHTGIDIENINLNGSIKGFGKIIKGKSQLKPTLHKIIKELLPPFSGLIVLIIASLFSFNINSTLIIIFMLLLYILFAYITYRILMPVPFKLKTFFESF